MATNARNGSALLRQMRETRDRVKSRHRFWELGGSRMGDAIKGTAKPPQDAPTKAPERLSRAARESRATEADAAFDHKSGNSFKEAMTEGSSLSSNLGASEFTSSKSIAEQRRALPVASVRDRGSTRRP